MAHYAKVVDGVVVNVIKAEQDFFETFIDDTPGIWIQTSYNTLGGKHFDPNTNEEDDGTPLRKNFAGIGYTYDAERDAFISPKPYPSWILNEETCLWEPPNGFPTGNRFDYEWDEETTSWVEIPTET